MNEKVLTIKKVITAMSAAQCLCSPARMTAFAAEANLNTDTEQDIVCM